MNCETGESPDSWHYAAPGTLAGALQRGLGRGAYRAMADPVAPELVMDCLRRDYRWDGVDERAVYLARLVRDLQVPIEPILAYWAAAPSEDGDDGNEFAATLDVLEVLGRVGVEGVVEGVRRYISEGERWPETLHVVASAWPAGWWDDLYLQVMARPDALAQAREWGRWAPWTVWVSRDVRIAAAVHAAKARAGTETLRPYADLPVTALLAMLRDQDRAGEWRQVLRELRRRPPEPGLLDLVDDLLAAGLTAPLLATVGELGPVALPAARQWVHAGSHPLIWAGFRLLAEYGDAGDAPALLAGLDWLDNCPDDLCGYDELVEGLARIGGPIATAALPRLRDLWFSPHSFERPAYLGAHVALDPAGALPRLTEGLWDCEAGVRLLAVQRAPLDHRTRERLRYLRDDPIETPEVRTAAAHRLDP